MCGIFGHFSLKRGAITVISYSNASSGIILDKNLEIPSHLGKKLSVAINSFFFLVILFNYLIL